MNRHCRSLILFLLALLCLSWPTDSAIAQTPAQEAGGWFRLPIPDTWRKVPGGDQTPIEGWSWYRCMVRVPDNWKDAPLTLYVEALDDARAAYVNGTRVGATGTFPPEFRSGLGEAGRYRVDSDLIQPGRLNAIAIRVFQSDPRPNFNVAPPVLMNVSARQAIRMEGDWQYHPGDDDAWSMGQPAEFGITDRDVTSDDSARARGLFSRVDDVDDIDRYVSKRKGDSDPLSPQEAEKRFLTPDDLQFQLVLSDPVIAQPLFMTWDERGRLWLLEYRQYPEIAGLKMVSRDVFLRSVYDKVPEPPPHGDKGRDRISVHEDTDGDGVYDKHHVFVDGLNLATSVAIGRGGAFVTNPPYLLFYPDADGDLVPDGEPEVLLEGFGLEDSHSVINSLRFGPDGWLYGAQGSTVSAQVRRPGTRDPVASSMGQLIWRYHPEQRRYEIFAEGGGNTFGVEIDDKGRIYSGHNGGDTRGFHYEQGGYYRKGFGKHGPLSNPYAFGFFDNMRHHSVPRFTHNFIIYEEQLLPDGYRGRLFGVEPLQGQVVMSDIQPFQSSFETKDLSRPVLTDDQWFRPVDIKAGPDGCIYVADMYEQRIDHSSHYAGRIDRTNGRVYRLRPRAGAALEAERLTAGDSQLDSEQLLDRLGSERKWVRQTALRLIGDRHEAGLNPRILDRLKNSGGQTALELLWALHLSGGLTDETAITLLEHSEPFVRAWTVRLQCDRYQVAPAVASALVKLAAQEPYLVVRKQLAASARRLPAEQAIPILSRLIAYDEDADDIHQPLMLWWALESKAVGEGRALILSQLLADTANWQRPLMRQHLVERLMKRYAQAGSREELLAAAELLRTAPDKQDSDILLKAFEEAFKGRSLAGIPAELVDAIAATGGGSTALRLRQGDPDAFATATAAIVDLKSNREERLQYLQILGEVRRPESIPALLQVMQTDSNPELVSASLTALQSFDDLRVGQAVIENLTRIPAQSRDAAETLLASREVWAIALLEAVDGGQVKAADVSETALRKMTLHGSSRIDELVEEHWGSVAGATTEQMRQEVVRLSDIINAASGNPKKGKVLYAQNCGKCHVLFEEGGRIGPDLTSFKRDDLDRILANVVNPSLEIREGFENHVVITTDGRVVNGFLADKDNQVVVLRGVDGQNIVIRRDEIEAMQALPRSVMPEGTLGKLTDQELRDLFAYLRATQPVNY